jgi:adenylate cyclase
MGTRGSNIRTTCLLALASLLASLAITLSGALDPFELKAFDLFSRRFNPATISSDIVLVCIDQQSIDALSQQQVSWPWPRQVYAPLVDYLAGAEAVFIDLLYTEPSAFGEEDDRIFAAAVEKAGNVHLPVFLTSQRRTMAKEEGAFLRRIALPPGAPRPFLSYSSAVMPIPGLLAAARGGGNVMMKPDSDGVYRRLPLLFGLGGETVPTLVLGDLLRTGAVGSAGGALVTGTAPLPLVEGRLLLRYSRATAPFPALSAGEVIASYLDEQAGTPPKIPRQFFRGKQVIVGPTAAGLYDLKPTAVTPVASGMEIHATLLENLLHRGFMTPLPLPWSILPMALLCLGITLFVLRHQRVTANLGFLAGVTLATTLLLALLFSSGRYLPVIPQATAILVAMIAATAYSYATEGRERRFVRRAFAQYMDETLVRHLLANPELIRPGGQRRRVTVFFADIAGFTTLAERLSAEETARILHTVLNAFSEVVIAHHGVIDKYIGDCIMAFWGAPLASGDDELNACRAALRCQEVLAELNEGFRREGLTAIAIRIGIHSGDAIVGNLGSDRLFDYTVVGDTVNLASRLESANKQFHTPILVSGDTLAATGGALLSRDLGEIAVKGKGEAVAIFTLLGTALDADAGRTGLAREHAAAMELFRAGRFTAAAEAFAALAAAHPGDGPAAYYRERSAAFAAQPPGDEGWQIIKMTEK